MNDEFIPTPALELVFFIHLKEKYPHLLHMEDVLFEIMQGKDGEPQLICKNYLPEHIPVDAVFTTITSAVDTFAHTLIPLIVTVSNATNKLVYLKQEEEGDNYTAHFMMIMIHANDNSIEIVDVNNEFQHEVKPYVVDFFHDSPFSAYKVQTTHTRWIQEALEASRPYETAPGLCVPTTFFFIDWVMEQENGKEHVLAKGLDEHYTDSFYPFIFNYMVDLFPVMNKKHGWNLSFTSLVEDVELKNIIYDTFIEFTFYE